MFTAGGNDAKFSKAIERCFAAGFRSAPMCRDSIQYAKDQFSDIIDNTTVILSDLENKLPSTSQVVLVGYPLLSLDRSDYILNTCVKLDTHTDHCVRWDKYDAAKAVRDAGKELNKLQADLVKSWNSSSSLQATFVDTQSSFTAHEPHPDADQRNPKRWINEFFETNGSEDENGDTKASYTFDQNNWYHPNIIGHRKIALDIINQIGIPSSAKEITPTSGDTDIVFAVDTTGSMGGAINAVKNDINTIASQIQNMSRSTRFSLISYQDHPNQGNNPHDYPAKTHLNFTSDISPFIASVNSLELGYGGDLPESVYSGAMAGLDQSWRPGVRKIMIIIGDAPAHDPEPITSYTWRQVAQRAYDIDPVEIYAIDVGYGLLSSHEIMQLTSQSGGKIIDVRSSNIPQAITASVSESLAKPFAWIQGPYIIKVGESLELDGEGSYAIDGEISTIEWDLDGDSVFETSSPSLLYDHRFTEEFSGTIGLRITDTNGNVGIGSTRLDVSDDGDSIPRHIDNCPDIANQNQADFDGDGIGDDCDDDIGWPATDMPGVVVLASTESETDSQEGDLNVKQLAPAGSTSERISKNISQATLINQIFQTSSPDTLGFTTTSPPVIPPATTKTDQPDSSSNTEVNRFNTGAVLFTTLGIGLVSLAGYSLYRRKKKS